MAEQPAAQDRTEAPTEKRKQESRKEGRVAKSMELTSAAILLSTVILFYVTGESFIWSLAQIIRTIYTWSATLPLSAGSSPLLFKWVASETLIVLLPFLITLLAVALLVNYLQVGVIFSTKALGPKWERLNPVDGLKRIFSSRGLSELVKGIAKMIVIGTIIYLYISKRVPEYPFLAFMSPYMIMGELGKDLFRIGAYVGLAFLIMALADYAYQRWEYMKKLRMTKQEVKDERKQSEGSPEIKARLKSRMRELSRNRMMAAAARATVVITNPVHLAVALRYDTEAAEAAPVVMAKGQRLIADRIKEIAVLHSIPIREDRPLAQALFSSCNVGEEIPFMYYQAVAQILAEIYLEQAGTRPAYSGVAAGS